MEKITEKNKKIKVYNLSAYLYAKYSKKLAHYF